MWSGYSDNGKILRVFCEALFPSGQRLAFFFRISWRFRRHIVNYLQQEYRNDNLYRCDMKNYAYRNPHVLKFVNEG